MRVPHGQGQRISSREWSSRQGNMRHLRRSMSFSQKSSTFAEYALGGGCLACMTEFKCFDRELKQ